MITYPNAKINLGLNIINKRDDGFHNIESLFYPVKLCDILEIIETSEETEFTSTGIDIPGDADNNLCLLAWRLLKTDFNIPNVKIHLHKVVPIGAGLGGGSADGAFTLTMLNDMFELELSVKKLEEYAAKLGSDCAFFIKNTPAFAEGRGEILHDFEAILKNKHIALINPGIHISTKEAYSGVKAQALETPLKELLQKPIANWQNHIINDFEPSIVKNHPTIGKLIDELQDAGAVYTAMTGSGSSVFGIFEQEISEKIKDQFKPYFYWQGVLNS